MLHVLHKSCTSIVHILRWLMLFVGIVEAWCCGIRTSTETALVHLVLVFVHQHYAVILLLIVASFKASINGSSNRATSIWELASLLFVWLIQSIGSTISSRFTATANGSVVTTCSITISTVTSSKVANVHSSIHSILVGKVTGSTLNWSFSIVVDVDSCIHIIVVPISLYWHVVLMLNWVTSSTGLSLLAEFSLGDGLVDVIVASCRVLTRWVHAWNHLIVVSSWAEKLLRRHHHLLLVLVTVWCFSLVHKIEKVSLIILSHAISGTNSVASNATWVDTKWACTISITCVGNVLLGLLIERLSSLMLLGLEIIHILLTSITLSDILHEVAIVHGISHLSLIIASFIWALRSSKATDSSLVEHLFLIDLSIYMREHFMNSGVISWL